LTGRAVQRRRLALLALLAVARRRGLTRDRIVAYIWPDADPERARHLLSDSVYRINKALGGEAILAVGDDLRLNPDRLSSDVRDFGEAMDRGEWERAAALYTAPFLDGFFVPDSGEFDRWADSERERLRRERARALEVLAQYAESRGDDSAAVDWWRTLARHRPRPACAPANRHRDPVRPAGQSHMVAGHSVSQ
jgi:DNA-binding SARP family transcriptional activator